MRLLFSAMVVIFLMSAFAIGITLQDDDMSTINEMIENASLTAGNFSFETVDNPYIDGMLNVAEEFIEFALAAGMEVMRMGILFGHDNPSYFEAESILTFTKLFIWVIALSVMFVPMMYLLAFLIMLGMWIKRKFFSSTSK